MLICEMSVSVPSFEGQRWYRDDASFLMCLSNVQSQGNLLEARDYFWVFVALKMSLVAI